MKSKKGGYKMEIGALTQMLSILAISLAVDGPSEDSIKAEVLSKLTAEGIDYCKNNLSDIDVMTLAVAVAGTDWKTARQAIVYINEDAKKDHHGTIDL
jgi:hypothetical protein